MHLRKQDDEMTPDQNQVSTTNIPNKIQLPHNNSNKSLLSEKEPRQVYISLRESKLSGSASSGHTYGNFLNYVESDKFKKNTTVSYDCYIVRLQITIPSMKG